MAPCLTDKVLHGVKVIDVVMLEMIGAIMSVILKKHINPTEGVLFDQLQSFPHFHTSLPPSTPLFDLTSKHALDPS